jgi:hypothetical protein
VGPLFPLPLESLTSGRLRRDALETDFRPRVVAKQVRRLCLVYVEMKSDIAVVTPAGLDQMEIGD